MRASMGERRCRQTTATQSTRRVRPFDILRGSDRQTTLDLISDLDRRFSSARSPVVRFYSHLLELMGKQIFFNSERRPLVVVRFVSYFRFGKIDF